MRYRTVQWGYSWVFAVVSFVFVVVALVTVEDASRGVSMLAVLPIVIVLAVVVWLSRLEVVVADDRSVVTATFGWGWPKRSIQLADVEAIRAVRNRWWYGLGIRKVPDGWMFNVWGLDAVELRLESGKAFRIGTADPEGLTSALRRRSVRH